MSFVPPGDRIAGYQVTDVLGVGSATIVYEVRDRDGATWALKLMDEGAPDPLSEELFERFERVVELGRLVRHPSLFIGHTAGRYMGRPYLVARRSPGVPLKRLRRETPPTRDQALQIIYALARSLSAAHAARITHRDLKPSNVLVVRERDPVVDRIDLVDFALASAPGLPPITGAGRPIGTMGYAAPELLGGIDAGPSSDVFTVGVLLYLLLTGERPFTGTDPDSYRAGLAAGIPGPPAGATPGITAILRRCFDPNPRLRFRKASELAEALEAELVR